MEKTFASGIFLSMEQRAGGGEGDGNAVSAATNGACLGHAVQYPLEDDLDC